MADREVTLKLGLDFSAAAGASKALAGIGAEADKQAARVNKLKETFKNLTPAQQASKRGQRVEGKIEDATLKTGTALKENVRLTLAREKAQKALNKALDAERNRQQYGKAMGGVRNLFGMGPKQGGAAAAGTPSITSGVKNVAAAAMGGGDGIGAALGGLSAAAMGAAGGLIALKSVALASPGAVERFTMTLEDTAAVVGQALTPVLEIVTGVVKLFADVLMTILPSAADMRAALQPISDLFRDVRDAIAPLAHIVKDVLTVALKALAVAVNIVLIPIRLMAKLLTSIFGGGDKLKDSKGAAAREMTFQAADSYLRSAYSAAYRGTSEGTGEYQDPIKSIGKSLDSLVGYVSGIFSKMGAKFGGEGASPHRMESIKDLFKIGGEDISRGDKEKKIQTKIGENIDRHGGMNPETLKALTAALGMLAGKLGIKAADRDDWIREQIDQGKKRALDG